MRTSSKATVRTDPVTFVYPAILTRRKDGGILVRFPDLPEALTEGDDEADALAQAADCLAEAIAGRMDDRDDIPSPSPSGRGQYPVILSALLAVKAALYIAMRRQSVSNAELARNIGADEKEIRRLLDPRHASKLARLEAALAKCGQEVEIVLRDVARQDRILGVAGKPGHGTIIPKKAMRMKQT